MRNKNNKILYGIKQNLNVSKSTNIFKAKKKLK